MQMFLDDYADSSNVGFCWALRLSQVLAYSECPIDSRGRGILEVDYASVIMKEIYSGN